MTGRTGAWERRRNACGLRAWGLAAGIACLVALSACLACTGPRGGDDATAGRGENTEVVTGFQDVACTAYATWPVPECTPTCTAGTFHAELPTADSYPPDPILFLPDGRTVVARTGQPGAKIGQATLTMLSADGSEEATSALDPCGEGASMELLDLDADGSGGFLQLAACWPGTPDQRIVLVRIDALLQSIETRKLLFGKWVERFSVSLAVVDGTPYLLYVTSPEEGGAGNWAVRLAIDPGGQGEQAAKVLVQSPDYLSARPMAQEEGYLVFRIEGQVPGDEGGEFDSVVVVDASGEVLARLDGQRYTQDAELEYTPLAIHVAGGNLFVAGQSWDKAIGPDAEASRVAMIERRKLDGTLLQQARLAMGDQTDFKGLLPLPAGSADAGTASWLVLLGERHFVETPDGGKQLEVFPHLTWLTSDLEARFATLAPEGLPAAPSVVVADCDCGYRLAWSSGGILHVARTNNVFRYAPEAASCDDGLSCTSDSRSDGTCALEVTAGCLGPDGCYGQGAPRSDNPCLVCGQNAECGFLWQPLVDKTACGFDGKCQDGLCRCDARWLVTRGSSLDMHGILAAGLQDDGQVLAWTRATQVHSYPQGRLAGLLVSASGEAADLGPVADTWPTGVPMLVGSDATYIAFEGKLKRLDRTGTAEWTAPLPTWQPPEPDGVTYGIVMPAADKVMAIYVGRKGQTLLVGSSLFSDDGEPLAQGSWQKSFTELEGEVEIPNSWADSDDPGLQGMALPDGSVLVLTGATQFPPGTDVGFSHEFMILVDESGKDAAIQVLAETHFDSAMGNGKNGFLACDDLRVEEWDLDGNKGKSHDLVGAVAGGKDLVRTCLGLVPGSKNGVRMLVKVRDKLSNAEHGEVLVLGSDWKLVQTIPLPLVPACNGISTIPGGGFLVTGALDSGVAAILRADADGRYRCW